MKRLALIPAKKKSVRLTAKNFININKKPLYKYSLNNLIKSKLFNKIHISSNILVNKKYQDFMRPEKLSRNDTPLLDVIHFVLKEYEKRNEIFDIICLAYATSPLINEKDIQKACKKFEASNKKFPMISVSEYNPSIDEAMLFTDGYVKPINKKKFFLDSKKHKKYYFETASFIFYSAKYFYKKKLSIKNLQTKFFPYILPREKSVDINTKDDLNFVKKLIKI